MSDKKKNLSEYDFTAIPDASQMSFAILVSEWNHKITFALRDGAIKTLKKHGVQQGGIDVKYVPGSFELPLAAKYAADNLFVDAVICLGCVIQGETRHFEFINNAVANGITTVGLHTGVPIIYGVLTPDTWEQAKERAGGKHGNKGDEAAITAIKMAALKEDIVDFEDDLWYDDNPDDDYEDNYEEDDDYEEDEFDDEDFDDNDNDITKLN
jgi:6,7-dimethyl-8-ribityllumazine synthase